MKARVAIRIPTSLNVRFNTRLAESEDYGLRGKSKWLSEVMSALTDMPIDNVLALNMEVEGVGTSEKTKNSEFRLDDELKVEMDSLLVRLIQRQPYVKWDTSMLVRGAIRYRLEHPEISYGTTD